MKKLFLIGMLLVMLACLCSCNRQVFGLAARILIAVPATVLIGTFGE